MQPDAVTKGVMSETDHKRMMTVLPYLLEYVAAIVAQPHSRERVLSTMRDLQKCDPGAKVLCKSIKSLYKISLQRPETADATLAVPEHAQHLLGSNLENRSVDMELVNTIGRRLHKAGGIAWLWIALECTPWFDTRDRTAVFMAWNGIDSNFSI